VKSLIRQLTVLLIFVTFLTGCAAISFLRPPTEAEVNNLVARQEFDQALAKLSAIAPSHPERERYQILEQEVRALADDYANTMVARAESMESEDDWSSALALLVEARRKYSRSEQLEVAEQQMLLRQSVRLSALDDDLLLIRAQRLLMELPLRQEIARVDPYNLDARRQVEDVQAELDNVTEGLTVAGERTLTEGDLLSAEAFLTTARRIDETPRIQSALGILSAKQDSIARAEQARLRQIRQDEQRQRDQEAAARSRRQLADFNQRFSAIIHQIEEALDQQQLLEAKRLVQRARAMKPDAEEVGPLDQQLAEKISRQVERYLVDGNGLYRGGSFERAKQIWETALELDPDNLTVRTQVDRVERVLANIRELQGRQVGRPPPPPPAE
jgi:tetratricopeptide (TPR) repeat protein